MTVYYCDSSAIVKRYTHETGSQWVRALMSPMSGNIIVISLLAGPESAAAFFKLARAKVISVVDATAARVAFERDMANQYQIVDVTRSVAPSAIVLAERHGLRGYDAVQLATALDVQAARMAGGLPALTFVSADQDLNGAAQAEGFVVENPNDYP